MYEKVGEFNDGIANVLFDDRWGFIDTQGNTVIDFKYAVDSVSNFKEGMATVLVGSYQSGFINTDGEFVIGNIQEKMVDYDDVMISEQNAVSISKNGKWGLYDLKGNLKIDHKYEDELFLYEDRIIVEDTDTEKYGVIDIDGNLIVDYIYDDISEYKNGYAIVEKEVNDEELLGFINKEGKEVIPLQYEDAENFFEGLAAIKINDKWGYIDENGKIIIEPQYKLADGFSNGFAVVKGQKKLLLRSRRYVFL